jgi:tripartite-type tricarboxylate transporter receptor subunit TctC
MAANRMAKYASGTVDVSREIRPGARTSSHRRDAAAWSARGSVAESGLADLAFGSWNGLHVPVGTPKPIIAKINAAVAKARGSPDLRQRMMDLGFTPGGGTPKEFGEFVKRDLERWTRIVKETRVKLD